MYVYQITNLINNKKYIGITNNYKRRWSEHINNTQWSLISQAIKKYGKENFSFEVLLSGLTIEQASNKEKELILQKDSLAPNGYNISKGGIDFSTYGENNFFASLSDEDAKYIKDHRYLPIYVLYDKFADKISYTAFKDCYHDKTYSNIVTNIKEYPYNFEFSCQFNGSKIDYDDVVLLREKYDQGIYWKDAYQEYKDIYPNEWVFWNIYNGKNFPLVKPEVFTEENKKKHSSLKASGENNSRAKLTINDVKLIRELYEQGYSYKQIAEQFPQVTKSTIQKIANRITWKNVP